MGKYKKSTKQLIKDLEPDELKEIIIKLVRINKNNESFLRYLILGKNQSGIKELQKEAEQKIYKAFYLRSGFPRFPPELDSARSVINEFSGYFRDSLAEIIALTLYYTECCLEHLNYGEDGRTEYSLLEVFRGACSLLVQFPNYINEFSQRLISIYDDSDVIGYLQECVDEELVLLENISGILLVTKLDNSGKKIKIFQLKNYKL
jgi:hypothetical protein